MTRTGLSISTECRGAGGPVECIFEDTRNAVVVFGRCEHANFIFPTLVPSHSRIISAMPHPVLNYLKPHDGARAAPGSG
jgi:hypothetical protein